MDAYAGDGWLLQGEDEKETYTEQEAVKPFQLSPDRDYSVGGSYSSSVGRRRELIVEKQLMAEDSALHLVEGAQSRDLAQSASQGRVVAGGVYDTDADRCFARYDRDHDGFLTRDDLQQGLRVSDFCLFLFPNALSSRRRRTLVQGVSSELRHVYENCRRGRSWTSSSAMRRTAR